MSRLKPILALTWSIFLVPVLAGAQSTACSGQDAIFCDDFESGDLSPWNRPQVKILTPSDGTVTSDLQVTVSGTFSAADSVFVNDLEAELDGSSFTVEVPLEEGTNRLIAQAEDQEGEITLDQVTLRRDTTPPRVVVETPRDGERLIDAAVTIAGTVNDIIPGATVNADDVTVTINGQSAAVLNRTFLLADLPLTEGPNVLAVTAVDRAGNTASTALTVTRESDLAGVRLRILGGNTQSATISNTLPGPLHVRLEDTTGIPLPSRLIEFEVVRGDGLLGNPADSRQRVQFLTDGQGEATVDFTLGRRSGEGLHRVRATTPGSLTRVEFCATALPGAPESIVQIMPPSSRGLAGEVLTTPLDVLVTDGGGNPVAGVAVTFTAEDGLSTFSGTQETILSTDADGIARIPWTLASIPFDNHATATFSSHSGPPVTWRVEGIAATLDGETSLSGIVQDSTGAPVVGARARLRGTDHITTTGSDGRFILNDLPPGLQKLWIEGEPADDPAAGLYFPEIAFEVGLLLGVANTLDDIVVLPFLDKGGERMVGGDEDVDLTLEGIPEARLRVFAGSVILPDGRRGEIAMSWSPVKLDKIPMVPPMGSVPFVVGTLQPGGIQLDPPAQVIYPNAEGLAPGDVADVFAFHQDVGQFVNVGPGTVSEDGAVIRTDPGFGLAQSGWHCLLSIPGRTGSCGNGCAIDENAAGTQSIRWWESDDPSGTISTSPPFSLTSGKTACFLVDYKPETGGVLNGGWSDSGNFLSFTTPIAAPCPPVGGPANRAAASITASSCGTTTVSTPIYRFTLPPIPPDPPPPESTCQIEFDVTVTGCLESESGPQISAVRIAGTRGASGALLLDENCTVSVANRTARVLWNGDFAVENVAIFRSRVTGTVPMLHRARATCLRDGVMETGQSDFFTLVPEGTVIAPPIFPADLDPIPMRISIDTPPHTLALGETLQLGVTATLRDGSTRDVTPRAEGTVYLSTNTNFLTITDDGLATSVNGTTSPQTVLVVALHQGNLSTLELVAGGPSGDLDNDGIPDELEILFGLDPTVDDSHRDADGDGLTNGEEIALGTLPTNADTDLDGIPDGLDGDPLRPEEDPPTLTLLSPQDDSVLIEGQSLRLSAAVADDGLVRRVDWGINGLPLDTVTRRPFDRAMTVPFGVDSLRVQAQAEDGAGNLSPVDNVHPSVTPDPRSTVQGSVVDATSMPVPGAEVRLRFHGLNAEYFDFEEPLTDFPDLTGRSPDQTTSVANLGFWNPAGALTTDPFGTGLTTDFAARFRGELRVTEPGIWNFVLRADDGARLVLDGVLVAEARGGEAAGTIALAAGNVSLVVEYFQGAGSAELTLLAIPPGAAAPSLLESNALILAPTPFTVMSAADGSFALPDVPTRLGSLHAEASLAGPPAAAGTSGEVTILPDTTSLPPIVLDLLLSRRQADDTAAGDQLGLGVDAEGDRFVVTAPGHDEGSGVAYIFERPPGGTIWSQVARLVPDDGHPGLGFGHYASLSGDTVAIAAPNDDDLGPAAGAAYVFRRDFDGTWRQEAKLVASDGAPGDEFAVSLALDGSTLVVGAYLHDAFGNDAGAVYVFERDADGTGWGEVAKLGASNPAAVDWFGYNLDLDGDTLAVTVPAADPAGNASGRVDVFERGLEGWSETAQLIGSGTSAVDLFGWSVRIDGDRLAVGAILDDLSGFAGAGAAYVFERGTAGWIEVAAVVADDPSVDAHMGNGVALDGDVLAVGVLDDDEPVLDAGAVLLFLREDDGSWVLRTKLTVADAEVDDSFGVESALSGDVLVVGAFLDDEATGVDSGTFHLLGHEIPSAPPETKPSILQK